MSDAIVSCSEVSKSFAGGSESQSVLGKVDLEVRPGDAIAIQGVSGSGKSTLLQILGGLMAPDSGSVLIEGRDCSKMSDREACAARNSALGFVYQAHHLMGEFTALENVAMPLLVRREGDGRARKRASEMLDQVGLLPYARKVPGQLSGGERQRVAIARALASSPKCVIADEPTGSLDRANADMVFDLLLRLCSESAAALVTATHDDSLAERSKTRYRLVDGTLMEAV